MNKTELIQRAKRHVETDSGVFQLAATTLSEAEVLRQSASIEKRQKIGRFIFKTGLFGCVPLAILASAFFMSKGLMALPESFPITALFSVFFLFAFAALAGIFSAISYNSYTLEYLKPIAGTYFCERVLECLKTGGSAAAQWRDIAVAERGQLHVVDYYVINALAAIHRAEVQQAAERERAREACAAVHGFEAVSAP